MDLEFDYLVQDNKVTLVSLARRPQDKEMLDVERIAECYLQRLHETLTPEESRRVGLGQCCIDDVVDSNTIMWEAFKDAGFEESVTEKILLSDTLLGDDINYMWNEASLIALVAMRRHELYVQNS
jgi:hypothetical protein